MSHPLVSDLPAPEAGQLTIYLFGPRPGEGLVVAFPDRSWAVIDSCREQSENLALLLLRRFGVERLALAVLTHPDADHFRGFDELVKRFAPDHIWAFQIFESRRVLLAAMADRHHGDGRWRELSAALDGINAAMQVNRASIPYLTERRRFSDVYLFCVSPCPADLSNEGRLIQRLVTKIIAGSPITDDEGHLIRGRKLDGTGNGISLALVLDWGNLRICLGGDVEVSPDENRGWLGSLRYLQAQGLGTILERVNLVKVSHHGSDMAFCAEVFARHAIDRHTVSILTPFAGGANPPPHLPALRGVREFSSRLGITARPEPGWPLVAEAGWSEVERADDASACCIVAACRPDGDVTVSAHGSARIFT